MNHRSQKRAVARSGIRREAPDPRAQSQSKRDHSTVMPLKPGSGSPFPASLRALEYPGKGRARAEPSINKGRKVCPERQSRVCNRAHQDSPQARRQMPVPCPWPARGEGGGFLELHGVSIHAVGGSLVSAGTQNSVQSAVRRTPYAVRGMPFAADGPSSSGCALLSLMRVELRMRRRKWRLLPGTAYGAAAAPPLAPARIVFFRLSQLSTHRPYSMQTEYIRRYSTTSNG